MNADLTVLSAGEYNRIRSGRMSPARAAQYIRDAQIPLRNFGETLRECYPEMDIQQRLAAAFQEDGVSADSVRKKVQNWLSGSNRPSNREDLFRIAFALSLSEAQANLILGQCTGYGIHYRDGHDVIYAWFLRNGRSYQDAKTFYASLPPMTEEHLCPQPDSNRLTQMVQNTFAHIGTEDELRAAYIEALPQMGEMHLRAYRYFEKYLNQLIHPEDAVSGEQEPDYSMDAVMDLYLSLEMPSGKSRRGYTMIQKLIKADWPNTTSLKNIRNHKEDVPRKLLLLLYIITENVVDDGYQELDEEYITIEERLDDHWWTLNAILTDCGMPTLDPRNPTDWLVLYAITATDEPMSERMEETISQIFANLK